MIYHSLLNINTSHLKVGTDLIQFLGKFIFKLYAINNGSSVIDGIEVSFIKKRLV